MKFRPLPILLAVLGIAQGAPAATWTNAAGGSWTTAANWAGSVVPIWGPDLTVDFSTLNLTANRDLNLGSTGKVVGKISFGDTTPSHQWDIVAQNGPLTLSTTTGKPVVEVVNSTSVLTVNVVGTQGFEKNGLGTLRLNNTANGITGEILVSNGTLQIRDGSTNTPTAFAAATMADRSLKVTGTGIIDLWRADASGTQNVTWTLPTTTLENGGTLRFRNNNGATYNHAMNAAIIAGPGGGTIANAGGTGAQSITLGGALSGSGALAYTAGAGTTRMLTVTSSNNNCSGNWTVSHTGAGTAILRAGAAGALGTGTVTLNGGATLENNATGGIDSLGGVTLNESTSAISLGANAWTNGAATLAAKGGSIQLGSASSSIASLLIDSPGPVTLDADAGGSLAAAHVEIRQGTLAGSGSLTGAGDLTKTTSGAATLSGTHSYTGATTVSAGALLVTGMLGATDTTVSPGAAIGGSGTIGGSLHLSASACLLFSPTDTLHVNGASVTFDDFGIDDLLGFDSGVPDGTYVLIDGPGGFDLAHVGNLGLANAVELGGGRQAFFESGSLRLVVVPEPCSMLMGGLGLTLLLRRRR